MPKAALIQNIRTLTVALPLAALTLLVIPASAQKPVNSSKEKKDVFIPAEVTGSSAVVSSGATAITAESCAPANNAIDPSETVTVNFDLSNVGTADTSNLVAMLQGTGGVTSPSGPQNYGVLVANGPPVTRPFTFTAGRTCGQTLTATFQLQDGTTDLGAVTFTFSIGAVGSPVSATYSTDNIATPIPDLAAVEIPINVADTGVATDVNVRCRANHTFDSDLVLELVGPDNTSVALSQRHGGSGDNFGSGANDCSGTHTVFDDSAATAISAGTAPFAGTFKPDSPLSAFNGKTITGTWKLRVTDVEGQDVGTVWCVQLEITRQRFVCCGVAGTPQIVSGDAPTVTAENYFPANNAPDPGETVTVSLPVINSGDGNTTNLVATLQNSGGVSPVTTSQNYGVVIAAGPSVSRSFTLTANGTCGGNITVTLHLQDGAIDLGSVAYLFQLGAPVGTTQIFSNAAPITIPASGTGAAIGAPAAPYPSSIVVSGAPTTITKLTMTIKNFTHTFPDDVDLLLVSPTGRKMIVMSDAGGSTIATNLNIILDDDATSLLPDSTGIASGTFKPSNYPGAEDLFPPPAPAGPYLNSQTGGTDTLASAFTGVDGGNPNGRWNLYVTDDANMESGNINGGWEITLINSTLACAQPVNAVSRKMHGGVPFDISLPLVGAEGVECRAGQGAGGDHQMIVTFATNVTIGGASVTSGTGNVVGSPSVAGNVVTINLSGVTNAQTIMVTLSNVNDGVSGGDLIVPIGVLLGDTSGNGSVSSTDVTQTKLQSGQTVDASNFRDDVIVNGFINGTDVSAVKLKSGTALP
jgi:subtilisin-like proprotein convertase family protein